jgi:hypothetical protein
MALFHFWNNARFPNELFINRQEVMTLSKIGSKGTYHKCINDLHEWKYLIYRPSKSPRVGSCIIMFDLSTTAVPLKSKNDTSNVSIEVQDRTKNETPHIPQSEPFINKTKPNKPTNLFKPKNIESVIVFFEFKKWPSGQANKFYIHYESVGWKKGISKIENWKAAAEAWIIRFRESEANSKAQVQKEDNLHTTRNKNYNEPL